MKAPQIIMIVMLALALLISANKHGKAKTGTENFLTTIVACIIQLSIMYWGGFFDKH